MKRTIVLTGIVLVVIGLVAVFGYAKPPRPGKSPVKMMDTDGDGVISEKEWTAAHLKMFREMDEDGDGYLSDDELHPPREDQVDKD
jgi:hypothetical protein